MEYVDGRNLRDLLRAGPLPAAQALEIVPGICDALQYAHDEGLVHRDVKPENILLDRKGRVKIADFGLAKLVGLTPAFLTLTGANEVMGTLLYMAPEQMQRAHTVDHRADLYSLGVVLYEMLTGELPLGRFAPPSHKAAVDERLDQVVLRALAREPAERYQDAGAFKQDVEAARAAPTTGAPGRVGAIGEPGRVSARREGRPVWPSARFQILDQGEHVEANGLVRRDDEALILEFEWAKKKYKSFFKEPGQPQEVRIPLHEIAGLSYGWGWGKPPRSVILKVTRLAALAGMPGSGQGRVQFSIPREDRDQARGLVESIRGPASVDREPVRQEAAPAAMGLLVSGMLGLFSWVVIGLILIELEPRPANPIREAVFYLLVIVAGSLVVTLSGVQVLGAAKMLRLRGYPWAGTAAILATIPWSPIWPVGLPFGIWASNVLGRPEVAEVFLDEKRRAGPGPAGARTPGMRVAGRFVSLLRSVGRYVFSTRAGRQTGAGDPHDASPSSIKSSVPRPGVNYPDEAR
jgi:hypothetical protein